jgi:hypothetical protein
MWNLGAPRNLEALPMDPRMQQQNQKDGFAFKTLRLHLCQKSLLDNLALASSTVLPSLSTILLTASSRSIMQANT